MQFSCSKEKLWEATVNVQHAVSNKSTISALEGLLLKTKDGKLSITGYDLEMGIFTDIEARVAEHGEIVLNAKLFSDIIKSLPEDFLTITVDEKKMATITAGKSIFTIMGFDAAEYPELPGLGDTQSLCMEAGLLKGMVRQTVFCVSQNDAKPVYTGILFEMGEDKLKLVAVDGFRLAIRNEPLIGAPELRFIVPGKTMAEICRLAGDEVEEIKLQLGSRHILFELDGYTVLSRLLDGEFLDYKKAVPDGYETQVRLNVKQAVQCIERISLLISDRLKSPVRCVVEENELQLSCVTAMGKANDSLDIKSEGERQEIGFNNRYLLDALKNSECDEVLLQLSGTLAPMKIVPCDGDSFLFLVLPVRLKAE